MIRDFWVRRLAETVDEKVQQLPGLEGLTPVQSYVRRVRSREALPLGARADSSFVWRSDPFLMMRWSEKQGGIRYSGVDLVVAYWLGRYSRWLPAPRTDSLSR